VHSSSLKPFKWVSLVSAGSDHWTHRPSCVSCTKTITKLHEALPP